MNELILVIVWAPPAIAGWLLGKLVYDLVKALLLWRRVNREDEMS